MGPKTETDYRITKGTGWLEIGGCGMVDPNVLKKIVVSTPMNIMVLLLNGSRTHCYVTISNSDIRMFCENDAFLEQFKALDLVKRHIIKVLVCV
jgi:phenylalanyl-tRNA synthetase alpha chain